MSQAITTVEITPQQLKMWSDTRAALIWHCPAFTHILYTMMNKAGGEHIAIFTREVPVAATDGQNVLINPDTFFPLSLSERIFVVAHEVSHGIFGHVEMLHKLQMAGKVCYPDGKELGFDNDTFQKAMDYVINDMLVESKIGTYNTNWLRDPVIATHKDSVLTAYRRLYEQHQKNGGGSGASQASQQKKQQGFDTHLPPGAATGQDPTQAAHSRSDVEWKTAVAGAVASAKAQGKLPAALERLLNETLEPTVDWTDKVIGFFSRKPGGGTYDWRKPDRRFITRGIVAPARTGYGAGPVVVALDSSGSVGQKELDVFFGNVWGILDDIRPSVIWLIWCDSKVHGEPIEIHDTADLLHVKSKGALGGGGTSFVPVFDEIRERGIEPDALIYLTDGEGTFPKKAPQYPVLWGNINPGKKYPWGEVVDVPIKAK